MYANCLYCKAHLGDNTALEEFPVGRRLAFDEARGRLWVVCMICRRWNLSPLEQRWEAVECAERLFRTTQRRMTTDNIGLAQLREGLELIRIGRPLPTEFAAWRYGTQLTRRRARHRVTQSVSTVSTLITGVPIPWIYDAVSSNLVVARMHDENGRAVTVKRKHLGQLRLLPEGGVGWTAHIRHRQGTAEVSGPSAVRMLGQLLPHLNLQGASAHQVSAAVAQMEEAGGPDGTFAAVAAHLRKWQHHGIISRPDHKVRTAPLELRLALEMAAHEDTERRALEGELAQLEAAWREAEEIAAIADSLLLPRSVTDRILRWRTGG